MGEKIILKLKYRDNKEMARCKEQVKKVCQPVM